MRSRHEADPNASREEPKSYKLEWVAVFPVWRNPVVIQQLALVFAIPLVILAAILTLILWPPDGEKLLMIGKILAIAGSIFVALLLIGTAVVSAGGYQMEYRLSDEGVGGRPHGRTATKNAVINALLVLSGRPTAMGAGLLTQSRQAEYVAWKDVDRIEADPRQRTIALYKGRRPLMVVACDEAHYEKVLQEAGRAVCLKTSEV